MLSWLLAGYDTFDARIRLMHNWILQLLNIPFMFHPETSTSEGNHSPK
jgi:hypothetical protein